jgi:protein-disulfide isomerase
MSHKLVQVRSILIAVSLTIFLWCWALPAQADSSFDQQVIDVIRQNPKVIIDAVQAYQQQQRDELKAAQTAFAEELLTQPDEIIGTSPKTSDVDGRAVLLEFSDFQCPFCAKSYREMKVFVDQHGDQVTLVYKHLPLRSIHSQALPAAMAAYAAQQQGQFWAFHDALFEHQDQLSDKFYLATARKLRLDMEQFERDRTQAMEAIQQDINLAAQLNITGTPFFVFQGQVFSGAVSADQFEALLPVE